MAFSKDAAWNLVLMRTEWQLAIYVTGTTVPTDTTTWYAKGCLFVDTDVVTWTTGLYVNVWTSASCVFKSITNAS